MAATLTGKIQSIIDLTYANTVGGQPASGNFGRTAQYNWASGVGANQADKIYTLGANSIAAAGTLDIDLAGSVSDIYGTLISFARVKAIGVIADPTNVNNVVMGNAVANQFLGPLGSAVHTVHVRPGGFMLFVAPDATAWAVTAATADILRFTNSGGGTAVLFDLVILGASA